MNIINYLQPAFSNGNLCQVLEELHFGIVTTEEDVSERLIALVSDNPNLTILEYLEERSLKLAVDAEIPLPTENTGVTWEAVTEGHQVAYGQAQERPHHNKAIVNIQIPMTEQVNREYGMVIKVLGIRFPRTGDLESLAGETPGYARVEVCFRNELVFVNLDNNIISYPCRGIPAGCEPSILA